MTDVGQLRQRAEEHRAVARTTADLWASTIRFALAARYEELAIHYEAIATRVKEPLPARRSARGRDK
jgi:hypothetical protein